MTPGGYSLPNDSSVVSNPDDGSFSLIFSSSFTIVRQARDFLDHSQLPLKQRKLEWISLRAWVGHPADRIESAHTAINTLAHTAIKTFVCFQPAQKWPPRTKVYGFYK